MTTPTRPPFALGFEPAVIPTALSKLMGFKTTCGCGRIHASDVKWTAVRRGAVEALPDFVREVGGGLTILVVADKVTGDIAGKRVLNMLGRDGHHPGLLILPEGAGGRPHADEANLLLVQTAVKGADLAVAVGSGTVNDLTKLASFQQGIPYMTVATAPSMNGYTSGIAAIMLRGVKRTVDCHQPVAVVADLDILCEAPLPLIAAGLGDLESKPTATADFRLAGILRGDYYCPAPETVVLTAEARAKETAPGLKAREPASIAALTEALILSGISMKLAGSSSPASGGEHLISHFWDMTAEVEGRVEGWHGAQVGVATIVTAALYEVLSELSPEQMSVDAVVRSRPKFDDRLPDIHRIHGVFAEEVVAEYRSKRLTDEALENELTTIKEGWEALWRNLFQVLRPAATVRDVLAAAGAPTDVRDIGLSSTHLDTACRHARFIRGRFTVLDFASDLGVFDKVIGETLSRVRAL